jgi:hypothetical protein
MAAGLAAVWAVPAASVVVVDLRGKSEAGTRGSLGNL